MVGKYIAQLETQLATRLLERNTRRQSLTDAGRVYFDEAKRVLEQVSIAENAVERLRAAPAGTLRVTAPTSFGGCVIAPLTATFLQRYPEVRVELDLTNQQMRTNLKVVIEGPGFHNEGVGLLGKLDQNSYELLDNSHAIYFNQAR